MAAPTAKMRAGARLPSSRGQHPSTEPGCHEPQPMTGNDPYCTPLIKNVAWRGGVVRASVVSTDTHNWIGASSPGFIDSPFDMPLILVFDRDDKTDVARRSGARSSHIAGRDHHRTIREARRRERAALSCHRAAPLHAELPE